MSEKIKRKTAVIIIAVVAVISIVGGSFAWFVTNSSLSQKFIVSGFEVSDTVYFESKGTRTDASKFVDSDGLYKLSLNENDENYIGNLRVTVSKTGSKACVRVRMAYEFNSATGAVKQFSTELPYKFNSNWYDNRDVDYCVYYRGERSDGKADFSSEELINGFNDAEFNTVGLSADTSVRVMIEVDAVQVNRYPQMWNIEKLPWK